MEALKSNDVQLFFVTATEREQGLKEENNKSTEIFMVFGEVDACALPEIPSFTGLMIL